MQRLYTFILLWLCTSLSLAFANNVTASFAADTVHACIHEVFEIGADVSGGTAPYQYQWSNGSTDSLLSMVPTQAVTDLNLVVTDALGDSDTSYLVIHALEECVYPGDANGDGTANNLDVLNLGLAFGSTGFIRPNAHLNWIGQPSPAWVQEFTDGINYAHVDGDGNGSVDQADLGAIAYNYIQPSSQTGVGSSPGGIPLFVQFDNSNALPGDTVVANIMLGTPSQPADSIYGVAFALEFEGYNIDSGSVIVNFENSILGREQDILTLSKTFYSNSRVEVGMTRFGGIDTFGVGRLAEIIVVIDEIIGKKAGVEILDFNLEAVSLNNGKGRTVEVETSSSTLSIITSSKPLLPLGTAYTLTRKAELGWEFTWQSSANLSLETLSILSMEGKALYTNQGINNNRPTFIPYHNLPTGIYILQLKTSQGYLSQKIIRP